ncbi:MAG: hypothetical protein WDA75_26065, partial [Candidatus Latescibacterota bacterium]
DVTVLADLPRLESLNLSFNAVQDLSPLLGLDSLKALELTGNPLDDRSLTEYLPALKAEGVQVTFATAPDTSEPEPPPAFPLFRLAFLAASSSNFHLNIFIARTDGGPLLNLLPEKTDFGIPTWSPDGSQLAFVSNRDDALRATYAIYAINADATGLRRLTQEGEPSGRGLYWSPDGAHIAFTVSGGSSFDPNGARSSLYVMDAGGGNVRRLTHPQAQDGDVCWSPDGSRIAFVRSVVRWREQQSGGYSIDSSYSDIYTVDLSGSDSLRLTNAHGYYWRPTYSPDGTRIAFVSDQQGQEDILVMNADGTGLMNLTQDPAEDWAPAWSVDGAEILFCSSRASTGGDFFAISADGGPVRQLSEGVLLDLGEGTPSWSPDRSLAAFVSRTETLPSLYVWDRVSNQVLNLSGDLEVQWPDSRVVWAPR